MIHETRLIPLDGRPHTNRAPPVAGRFARPVGGQRAGHRHHQLQRQDQLPGIRRGPAPGRALHPRRRATTWSTSSPLTIRPRGRSPGPHRFPPPAPTAGCTSTPVTKATTRWSGSCPERGLTKRQRRNRKPEVTSENRPFVTDGGAFPIRSRAAVRRTSNANDLMSPPYGWLRSISSTRIPFGSSTKP